MEKAVEERFDRIESLVTQLIRNLGSFRSEVKKGFETVRTELRGEMHDIRDEPSGEIHEVRDELRGEMYDIRDELTRELGEVSGKIDHLETSIVQYRDEVFVKWRELLLHQGGLAERIHRLERHVLEVREDGDS